MAAHGLDDCESEAVYRVRYTDQVETYLKHFIALSNLLLGLHRFKYVTQAETYRSPWPISRGLWSTEIPASPLWVMRNCFSSNSDAPFRYGFELCSSCPHVLVPLVVNTTAGRLFSDPLEAKDLLRCRSETRHLLRRHPEAFFSSCWTGHVNQSFSSVSSICLDNDLWKFEISASRCMRVWPCSFSCIKSPWFALVNSAIASFIKL